jgi:hypothetical protein
MSDFYSDTPIHKLTLSLRPEGCLIANPELAEQIRRLPEVFRVESNAAKMEIAVWFVEPAEGLLAAINNALKSHGCDIVAGRVRRPDHAGHR